MTEREINRALRHKYANPDRPSAARRMIRKHKLRGRYRDRLFQEIERTREKYELLLEILREQKDKA